MNKPTADEHAIPSNFIFKKLKKLKAKHEMSLAKRLNKRKYLKNVICNWINFTVFRAWRKWKSIQILPTSYEIMKSTIKGKVSTLRHQLYTASKKSRTNFFCHVAENAEIQRSRSRMEKRILVEKKFEDFRNKSTLVRVMREHIVTASRQCREKLKSERNILANEIRSYSRARMRKALYV